MADPSAKDADNGIFLAGKSLLRRFLYFLFSQLGENVVSSKASAKIQSP